MEDAEGEDREEDGYDDVDEDGEEDWEYDIEGREDENIIDDDYSVEELLRMGWNNDFRSKFFIFGNNRKAYRNNRRALLHFFTHKRVKIFIFLINLLHQII